MRHDTGELAEIRGLLAAEMDGAAVRGMRTVDLVRGLLKVAHRTHGTVEAVRRRLVACGIPNRPSVVTMTATACHELAAARMSGEVQHGSIEGEESARVVALLEAAVASGTLRLSAGASAGLREAMTGESGAIEIALTQHEVMDLGLSGVAFTEVGDGRGEDVLIKLVDTTGQLRRLVDLWRADGSIRDLRGPEGQRGQQQPDRRDRAAPPAPDEDEGGGEAGH